MTMTKVTSDFAHGQSRCGQKTPPKSLLYFYSFVFFMYLCTVKTMNFGLNEFFIIKINAFSTRSDSICMLCAVEINPKLKYYGKQNFKGFIR